VVRRRRGPGAVALRRGPDAVQLLGRSGAVQLRPGSGAVRVAGALWRPGRPGTVCPPRPAGPGVLPGPGILADPRALAGPVARTVLAGPALATGQAAHRGDEQHTGDDRQGHPRAHVRHRHRPEMVDAVRQQRLADELDPDEPEDDGQAGRQIHQPVQQPADQEIEVS
jgi:hypothetical protein